MRIDSPTTLLNRIRQYVNDRDRRMQYYGAHRTLEKVATVATLLRYLDYMSVRPDSEKCRWVLHNLSDLYSLRAGKHSRYYQSDREKLESFEAYARQYFSPELAPTASSMFLNSPDRQGDAACSGAFSNAQLELL